MWVAYKIKFNYGIFLFVRFFGARFHDHDLVFLGKLFLSDKIPCLKCFLNVRLQSNEDVSTVVEELLKDSVSETENFLQVTKNYKKKRLINNCVTDKF